MVVDRLIYCPQCGGMFVVIAENKVYCLRCRLTFSRKFIEKINPENVLPDEELQAIANTLTSLKTKHH